MPYWFKCCYMSLCVTISHQTFHFHTRVCYDGKVCCPKLSVTNFVSRFSVCTQAAGKATRLVNKSLTGSKRTPPKLKDLRGMIELLSRDSASPASVRLRLLLLGCVEENILPAGCKEFSESEVMHVLILWTYGSPVYDCPY